VTVAGVVSPLASVELRSRAGTRVRVVVHDESLRGVVEETFPAEARDRAATVARALASVRHPNVAPITGAELRAGGLVVTSELVFGERLDELVAASNAAVSLPVRLRILVDVLAGLSAVHETGTALRCLGPAHVVVGTNGAARIVHAARAALTPASLPNDLRAHVAPELREGGEGTPRGDVWSAGMLLAQAIARRGVGEKFGEAQLRAGVEGTTWAEPLVPLALRALSVDPGSRPATAAELAAAIRLAVRSRLASHERVARELEEYAGERLAARRSAWLRASGRLRLPEEPSPFDAPTAPLGLRTIDAEGPATTDMPTTIEAPPRALVFEAKTRPVQASEVFFSPEHEAKPLPPSAPSVPDGVPSVPDQEPRQVHTVTGAHDVRAPFESTGGLLVPPVDASAVDPLSPPFPRDPRRRALALTAGLVGATAAALAVALLRGHAPAVALHVDAAATLRAEPVHAPAPGLGASTPPPPAVSPSAGASVRPPAPPASAAPKAPKRPAPKTPRAEPRAPYNPSSI
jgi:serine/threonine protein kinase